MCIYEYIYILSICKDGLVASISMCDGQAHGLGKLEYWSDALQEVLGAKFTYETSCLSVGWSFYLFYLSKSYISMPQIEHLCQPFSFLKWHGLENKMFPYGSTRLSHHKTGLFWIFPEVKFRENMKKPLVASPLVDWLDIYLCRSNE